MVQIGKTAIDQGANEIQRKRRPLVSAQYELRIGLAIRVGKRAAIDEIAAVTWQRYAVPGFRIGGAWLRILPCHAADTNDRFLQPIEHDQAHLQQDLDLGDDTFRRAVGEGFRAVTPLQHKRFAPLGTGNVILQ